MTPAAVVFDLFGTLLDIASLNDTVAPHVSDPAAFVATWREKQLAYAFACTLMEMYADFDEMTRTSLDYAAAKHGVELGPATRELFEIAWWRLAPHPDALPALAGLRDAGIPRAVLTNGSPSSAAAAIENAGLGPHIDTVLSVDAVRAYKPSPAVYALATTHFGVPAEQIVFVSANGWDATGAAAFGLHTVWCNRLGAPAETFGPKPNATISGLRELVEHLR
jgi:2-haloacid dehalogenase